MANQDLTINQFPAAITLTGTEPLPVMQIQGGTLKTAQTTSAAVASLTNLTNITGTLPVAKGGTGTTNPGLVQGTNINITGTWPNQTINALGTGTSALGHQSLSIKSANFATITANAPMIKNYQFGSAVAPGPGITTITNLVDLANNFNAFEDFTLLTSINSEIERYQPFNSANHIFNASNLTLQGLNPNNDWQCTNITQSAGFTAGAPIAIAALGLVDTSTVQVGQMCSVQGGGSVGGAYYITAINPNTTVTLTVLNGAPGTQVSTGLIFWLPVYGAALSLPYINGGTILTFSSLPAGVVNGMALGFYNQPLGGVNLNRSADWRVSNIAVGGTTVVTFGPPVAGLPNLSAGVIVWFLPVVTSGQIWSKLQVDLTNPQTFMAIQADLNLFPNWVPQRTANIGVNGELTLAQFNALPANLPFGGWPAFWMYSADDGNSNSETGSASEVDFMEIQIGCTQDCANLNSGAVSYTGSATMLAKTDSGWGYQSAFGIFNAPTGTTFVGRNLYQWIFANGMEYRFFNGILYKARQFQWINQRPSQFSVGLAMGGLNAPLVANTIIPNNPASFPNIQVGINSIQVWYQSA